MWRAMVGGAAMVALCGVAEGAPVVDQRQDAGPVVAYASAIRLTGGVELAQGFAVGRDGTLGRVELRLGRTATTDGPLTVEIRAAAGGLPAGPALATATILAAAVPAVAAADLTGLDARAAAFAWAGADLSLAVFAGESLAIVLRAGGATGGYAAAFDPGDLYLPGVRSAESASAPDGFLALGGDLQFRTYVEPSAVPEPASLLLLGLGGVVICIWRSRPTPNRIHCSTRTTGS